MLVGTIVLSVLLLVGLVASEPGGLHWLAAGAGAGLAALAFATLGVGRSLLRSARDAAATVAALARGERLPRRAARLMEVEELWDAIEALQAALECRERARSASSIASAHALAAESSARRASERQETRLAARLQRERSARREAESLSQSKDGFVAMVSHELRTPLSAIYGWTRLLRRGVLDPQAQARALEVIERSTCAQTQLIDDLLDMSRAVRGSLRLDLAVVDLAGTLRAAADAVRPSATAKGIELAVAAEAPTFVHGDAYRLQQVLCNLLANSIKFTASGGRTEASLTRAGDAVQLRVRDTGEGIAPAERSLAGT